MREINSCTVWIFKISCLNSRDSTNGHNKSLENKKCHHTRDSIGCNKNELLRLLNKMSTMTSEMTDFIALSDGQLH